MSNKLIDFDALSNYKTYADLKYQDKLTPSDNISMNNGVVSVAPTYREISLSNVRLTSGTKTTVSTITLMPGNYILSFVCQFASNSSGRRRCSISTNTNWDGMGLAYMDIRKAANGALTHSSVFAMFQVSATDYPNGRTFYLLALQNSGSSITVYPRCYYLKF